MNITDLIKPKNNLLKKQMFSKIFKELFDQVIEFDTEKQLKNDLEFVSLVCNLLEYLVDKHRKNLHSLKIDKKKLVCDIFSTVYDVNEEERKQLEDHIQFIFENGMITKVTNIRIWKKGLSSFVKKNFSIY